MPDEHTPDLIAHAASQMRSDNRADIEKYFESLSAWPAPLPPGNIPGPPKAAIDEVRNGRTYSCTTTPYSLTTNPEKIVTFAPDVAALWPGALLQGNGYLLGIGSLRELPIDKRAPLQVSITLLTTPNTITVAKPNAATVGEAVASLITPLEGKKLDFGASISFDKKETYSSEQAMLSLGLSAKYAGAGFTAKHSSTTSHDKNVITAAFIQNLFTAYVNNPTIPADLFSPDFSLNDVEEQERLGRIGKDNIPVFLSSVSYGRMLYVTISSSASFSDLKTALDASYNASGQGGSAEMNEASTTILNEAELTVSGIGIEEDNANALIRAGKIQEFFTNTEDIRSVKPISYIFYNLRDLSIAAFTDTATYNITVCQPKVIGNPSGNVAQRCSATEAILKNNHYYVLSAIGNWADPDTRRLRVLMYRNAHSQIIGNLDWLRTNAPTLSGDDKAWLREWVSSVVHEVEAQFSEWLGNFNSALDTEAHNIAAEAMGLSGAQRTMLTAIRDAL